MSLYNTNYDNKYFIFLDYLDEIIIKNIKKFKNLNIIYLNSNYQKFNLKEFEKIKKFCKIKKIKLYLIDDFKKAIRLGVDGIYLTSNNKKIYNNYKNSFEFIGSAHTQREYYFKYNQKCKYVFLSPIFDNKKYSKNKILGPIKFNLLSINWRVKTIALGGVNNKNYKKIFLTKSHGIGFISWIKSNK